MHSYQNRKAYTKEFDVINEEKAENQPVSFTNKYSTTMESYDRLHNAGGTLSLAAENMMKNRSGIGAFSSEINSGDDLRPDAVPAKRIPLQSFSSSQNSSRKYTTIS